MVNIRWPNRDAIIFDEPFFWRSDRFYLFGETSGHSH